MTHGNQKKIGILPALELLPFFDEIFMKTTDVSYASYASYGSIARDMLVGNLSGGVLPWEIFTSEVFALPGQRNQWTVAFFSNSGPAELVLQPMIYKSIQSEHNSSAKKVHANLQIGIESRTSITCQNFLKWLQKVHPIATPKVSFKFLPMDQRLQGLPADAIDGFLARSPWGLAAEEKNLGLLIKDFSPIRSNQLLVTVCRKDSAVSKNLTKPAALQCLTEARKKLTDRSIIESSASRMDASGRPRIPLYFLVKAAKSYDIASWDADIPADEQRITSELKVLQSLSMLPPQIAATAQTAKLLISA